MPYVIIFAVLGVETLAARLGHAGHTRVCYRRGTEVDALQPELSLAMPLYDEAGNVERVVRGLVGVLDRHGVDFEMVLVNNGSRDATGEILHTLQRADPRLQVIDLPVNAGYGGGILAGLSRCRGRYVGYAWGDDQIAPEDVLRVYQVLKSDGLDLCKAIRVVREDSTERKVISRVYNRLFGLLFPVRSHDVNGCPKIFRAEALRTIRPVSRDWFLDAEVMIKAHRHQLRSAEVPVTYRRRRWGGSHVRVATLLEFLWNMLRYRVTGR